MGNNKFINDAKTILWTNKESRKKLEEAGVKISPCNFYSSIPSITEIENSYEYADRTIPPYSACGIWGCSATSLKLLQKLTIFSAEFQPPDDGDEVAPKGFFWRNSQFSYADAMSYYAFLRYLKPKRVIEIGSGFSTLVAIDAINRNALGEIIGIEPYPRKFIEESTAVRLHKMPAQNVTSEWLNDNLSDGDVLFIDSTHTVKTESDCLHIYLRLLPRVKRNIYIHVHDVFLPFGMPQKWLQDHHIYWTEQYILLAFLLDNNKASFLYGSSYHEWANKSALKEFMHGSAEAGGSSFWFEYCGAKP